VYVEEVLALTFLVLLKHRILSLRRAALCFGYPNQSGSMPSSHVHRQRTPSFPVLRTQPASTALSEDSSGLRSRQPMNVPPNPTIETTSFAISMFIKRLEAARTPTPVTRLFLIAGLLLKWRPVGQQHTPVLVGVKENLGRITSICRLETSHPKTPCRKLPAMAEGWPQYEGGCLGWSDIGFGRHSNQKPQYLVLIPINQPIHFPSAEPGLVRHL
jgi:hypothetical protein